MALRRWKPFLDAFVHIDAAIEAAAAGGPDRVSRDEFRSARARIVEMLCDAADDDGVTEGLCRLLDDAMAESLVTLRMVAAEKKPELLASGELVAAVGALMSGHASERVRGLARDVVRGWRAGVDEELARAKAAMDVLDGLSEHAAPVVVVDTKKQAKIIPEEQLLPKKTATTTPVADGGRIITATISGNSTKQRINSVRHVKTPANMDASTRVPALLPKKTSPMESTKRKLHERYQEAEDAKRRRTIRVIQAPPPPSTVRARGSACGAAERRRFFSSTSTLMRMGRKRARDFPDVSLSPPCDVYESDDDDSTYGEPNVDLVSDTDDDNTFQSDDDDSSDSVEVNDSLYHQCVKELMGLEKLKEKITKTLRHKAKKVKSDKKQKDAFTRFSVSYFSSVIEALSPERKDMIASYGFGSLLQFQKCFVPNKFAQWVARQVDFKSGDIVVKPRIISLTAESVNLVLGLPTGDLPFPKNVAAGKNYLLSRFGLSSIPSVKYFGDKLLKNVDMPKEDVFACFILVALNCFLCPNSSVFPASKYLGIFEDLENVDKFKWPHFILDWLLDSIKTFNMHKSKAGKGKQTLGGCLYFLAVIYLDFVDFGPRQVPPGFPRIVHWKDMMIKLYSELDQVAPGVYGFRPVMDISTTCYSKQHVYLYKKPPSLAQNADFIEQLAIHCGGKLPTKLSNGICQLIEEHSMKSALTMTMDITSLASLSDDLKKSFSTLLQHAYSVDSRTQNLVLNILKLLSDNCDDDAEDEENPLPSQKVPEFDVNDNEDDSVKEIHSADFSKAHVTQQPNNVAEAVPKSHCSPHPNSTAHEPSSDYQYTHLNGPSTSKTNAYNSSAKISEAELDKVMSKLAKKASQPNNYKTPQQVFVAQIPGSGKRTQSMQYKKNKSRIDLVSNCQTDTEIAKLRADICDIDDDDQSFLFEKKPITFVRDNGERDVIYLDNVQEFRSEFVTPSPNDGRSRYVFKQRTPPEEDDTNCSTQQTPMYMQTLESSQPTPVRVTPNLSQHRVIPCLKSNSLNIKNQVAQATKDSPEVQITGERNVFQKASDMSKKSEELYNSNIKLQNNKCSEPGDAVETPVLVNDEPNRNATFEDSASHLNTRPSTTGGKLPHYGPRRVCYPANNGQFNQNNGRNRFPVADSELKNYRAICKLAYSKYQDNLAIEIGGVKCTFRSLGESMKSGGIVNNFVVAVFCRHLFMKPNGHPDVTKKHFFFSSIGDNFLKHPSDAKYDVLQNAFYRSNKARALPDSNLLFFPIFFENHWFVFVVDIKDQYFMFLDSYYGKDSEYQQHCRDRLIPSFIFHWEQFVDCKKDMKFNEYRVVYPPVPQQGQDNLNDGGVFVLMFLQHWNSPRSVLSSIFDINDIPNIRVKITNELFFLRNNTGMKRLVLQYDDKDIED
ncbi:hypothetical protein ACP70R_028611 [Stipagrostis hirtigluma subsp. patula]